MTYYSVPPYTWQPYDELIERLEGSQGPRGPTDGGEQRKFFPTDIQSPPFQANLEYSLVGTFISKVLNVPLALLAL
ncbi:hypothetical protein DTO027B9_2407 [Paecilomyces variotii]|nr:hypothetical protein DTO027B9_2407 [Paecilomyces variotii]